MNTVDRLQRVVWHLSNMAMRLPAFIFTQMQLKAVPQWICIAEQEGWSIAEDAKFVSQQLRDHGIGSHIVSRPDFMAGNILHYCSLHTYSLRRRAIAANRNKHVLTCFHGDFGIDPEMNRQLQQVINDKNSLDAIIVSCSLMHRRFLSWGMPAEKLQLIPLPVDTSLFRSDQNERDSVRHELGIPEDAIVVGSFQKDGVGHADGMEPKMIKGPDIFCEVVERLNRRYPIVVLLTGPARGYVKSRLERAGVRYVHRYAKSVEGVARYYSALDLYLMTSREEGGPKSVLESLASGVPFIGTDVGMVSDVLSNGRNGWKCPSEDVDALFEACEIAILNEQIRDKIRNRGLEDVRAFSRKAIGEHYANLYRQIVSSAA